MSEERRKVARRQMGLMDMMEEVKQLKAVIKEKEMDKLERRINDLDTRGRYFLPNLNCMLM